MFSVEDFSFYLQKRHNSKCVTLVKDIMISLERHRFDGRPMKFD